LNTDINILTTRDLQIGYEKPLCKSLNLNLKCGNLTCLIGPNGAGKSTLLRTLANLQPPISGQIFISDVSIQSISKSELTRSLSIVLTDKMAAGGLTVYELAAMGRHPYTNFFGRITDDDKNIIDKSLEQVGVMCKKESYVSELSDGERQKVMIAKALAQQTPILILGFSPKVYISYGLTFSHIPSSQIYFCCFLSNKLAHKVGNFSLLI